MKRILLLGLLIAAAPLAARDKPENWIEVRSQHFVVSTNSSEKQGRRIADQFERMRSVFHIRFPKLQIDPPSPIIVLAVKDEKDFRALEPPAYLAKGQLKLGGLFMRAPDKNYVLMRVDAEGDHPYAVVYHEYTHLLLGKSAEWLPLWLNEGLAEFYQNTDIHQKDVSLGEPSADSLALLREQRLLPLATLFAVDEKSPYYHEENKGSIFYAEAWALTHLLQIKDFQDHAQRLTDYAELLAKNVNPVDAAKSAFGDLQKLQSALEGYVRQASFYAFKMTASTDVDEATFKVQSLPLVAADALRADFLAYEERVEEARSLLDGVLKDDPNNVSAHETMGLLEFRQGHLDEAKKWYGQAVQLDSQSYLAHYYFAAMSMNGSSASSDDVQVESSLRSAIKLNPSFAPAFDTLAVFLGTRHRNLDEAHIMGLTAVSLDPGNIRYRLNVANVFMVTNHAQNAVQVLRVAAKLAKTPEEIQAVDNSLIHAQEYAAALEQRQQHPPVPEAPEAEEGQTSASEAALDATAESTSPDTFVAKGPHRFLTGTLKSVHCKPPQMDLTVDSSGKTLALHAQNYYKIQFTALNFAPSSDLNPCKDLEGRPAKVEYVESADQAAGARVLAVELHK